MTRASPKIKKMAPTKGITLTKKVVDLCDDPKGDGLDIPPKLRRKVTADTRAVVDQAIVKRPTITMPAPRSRATEEEKSVATINTNDPALPVEVSHRRPGQATQIRSFTNLEEFGDWFDPHYHKITGSSAGDDLTLIEVIDKFVEALPAQPSAPPKAEVKADKRRGKKSMKVVEVKPVSPPLIARSYTNGVSDEEVAHNKAVLRARDAKVGAIPPSPKGKGNAPGGAPSSVVSRSPLPSKEKKDGRGGHNKGTHIVRHGCTVNEDATVHKSVYAAFETLRLNISKHVKFRKELKLSKGGRLTYEENGKKYAFELVSS